MREIKASVSCTNAAAVGKAVSFHGLFRVLFPESDSVMAVYSTGLKKNALTYRQMVRMVLKTAPSVARRLTDVERGSEVGLCMHDGVRWIAVFWALMMNGYRPVLMCPQDGPASGKGPAVVITGEDIPESDPDSAEGIPFGNACIPPESAWADGFFFRTSVEESCRFDIDAARSAVIRAMDMPRGRTYEVKALVFAPLSSPLGLFSLLALQAMGAVAVLVQEGKAGPISDQARSHDVTHIVAYPLALSAMAARMRRRTDGPFGSGALDKALSCGGLFGRLRYGSLFRHVRTEMTGLSVEVIYTIDDDLNPGLLSFFSRIGYITGCFSDGNGYKPQPVENAVSMNRVRSACLVSPQAGKPVLVVSLESGMSGRRTALAMEMVRRAVSEAGADGMEIVFTTDDLSRGGYRLDRARIASDLAAGRISLLDQDVSSECRVLSEEEVRKGVTRCFAKTLDRPVEEISYTGDFFTSFGGESLDYFVLLSELESTFDVVLSSKDGSRLSSVKTLTRYIMDHQED